MSKKHKKKKKQRTRTSAPTLMLSRYCNTNGTELPPDWQEHLIGGEYEDECVFCKDRHYESNYILPPIEHDCYLTMGVCQDCMTDVIHGLGAAWAAAQDDLSMKTPIEWNAIIHDVLVPYITKGTIPTTYFEDKDPKYVPSLLKDFNKQIYCDFCSNEVHEIAHFVTDNTKGNELYTHILRPISERERIVVPPAICCNRCDHAIDQIYSRIDLVKAYKGAYKEKLHMHECSNCNASYPITVGEEAARELSVPFFTTHEYICPMCAEEHWGAIRCPSIDCDNCGSQFTIDLLHKSAYHVNDIAKLCSCHKDKDKNGREVFTQVLEIYNKKFTISYMQVDCGAEKRMYYTVKDDSIPSGKDNIIQPLTSQKMKKCRGNASDNCYCTSIEKDQIEDHMQELIYLLCEYTLTTYPDANNSS